MTALVFQSAGFAALLVGLALWSIPAALVIGGAILFLAGGLEGARGAK